MVKLLFSNKNIGILGVIFIAPCKAGLHLNLESYFFILYHKKDIIDREIVQGKVIEKGRFSFGFRPLWYL